MKKDLIIFTIFIFLAFVFWGAITLSEEYISEIPIPFKIILKDPSMAVEGNVPEKIQAKIRTNGWELIKIKFIQIPVFELIISSSNENVVFNTSSISNEQIGLSSTARILNIKPEIIKINFNIVTEKKVKIYPRLNYTLKNGFEIVSPIILDPKYILVKGSKGVLSKIDSLPTEVVDLEELSDFTSIRTVILDTMTNLLIYDKIPINISFDVQQIVDREFDNVRIELVNVPKNEDVILLPSLINLKLRGGIKILGRMTLDSIKVFVDYNRTLNKESEIIPEFHLPYGVKLLDYSPKQFKLLIRK